MKKRSRITRKHSGGAYSFGSHAVAPEAPYAQEVLGGQSLTPDCHDATRPGLVAPLGGSGGLPGFAGGAYTTNLTPLTSASAGMGGYPVVSRVGCEGGLVTTDQTGVSPHPTLLQNGGVANLGNPSYIAPTAGYTTGPSGWVSSAGSPSLINTPYDARMPNPACNKTGGARRRSRKSRSRKLRSRKSRFRKSRK